MEGEKGHTKEEVDRILREAEALKRQAEAKQANENIVSPEELTRQIEELGPDFREEQDTSKNID